MIVAEKLFKNTAICIIILLYPLEKYLEVIISYAISHSCKSILHLKWTRLFLEKHFKLMLKLLQKAHFSNIKRHSCCRSVSEGFELFYNDMKIT